MLVTTLLVELLGLFNLNFLREIYHICHFEKYSTKHGNKFSFAPQIEVNVKPKPQLQSCSQLCLISRKKVNRLSHNASQRLPLFSTKPPSGHLLMRNPDNNTNTDRYLSYSNVIERRIHFQYREASSFK